MNRRHFCSGAVLALAGCATAPMNSYRLAAIDGAVQPGGPASIGVRSIGIPAYLDQSGIVKSSGAYQFNTYDNEVWAAPLAGMLQAVMAQDLAQRLPAATVLASGGAIDSPVQVYIEINVQKFDPDETGDMVLLAQVAVKTSQTHQVLRSTTLRLSAPASFGPGAIAAVMSRLWAQAATQISILVLQTPAD
jgi:uncharacterized lipoprotein YmbA